MNLFCALLGHTWVPRTYAPEQRWTNTKDGVVLLQDELRPGAVRHVDRCQRCGLEREAGPRRHDADRPAVTADGSAPGAEDDLEDEQAA